MVLPPPQEEVCKLGMPPHARGHMPKLPDFLAIFRNGKNKGALHNKDHFPPGREKCKQDKIKTPPKKAKQEVGRRPRHDDTSNDCRLLPRHCAAGGVERAISSFF